MDLEERDPLLVWRLLAAVIEGGAHCYFCRACFFPQLCTYLRQCLQPVGLAVQRLSGSASRTDNVKFGKLVLVKLLLPGSAQ